MKIYISTDLEGVTGIFKFTQTRCPSGTAELRESMRLLMGDIAAVGEGLRQAGATEILAMDGHDGGNNFLPECMVAGIRYITGTPREPGDYGLDESCAGVVLLGFHAMNGTPDGVLAHTQSSAQEAKYWYDGVERGEMYQSAVVAGHFNVPVILVTSDEAGCREARALLGKNLPTVAVKKGISREAAVLLSAEETRPMLIEGARRAVAALPKLKPYKPTFPVKMRTRRMGSAGAKLETPWYVEQESIVRSGLDIISGGPA